MTTLFDDPAAFAEDMLEGFVDLHADTVMAVPGGVVRAEEVRAGKVAVVVGGGSGHYPAFCGLVGPGFADGAVVGNVFTSPSVADVQSVARAADAGGGVLLTAGNYAGDLLNFTLAAERLQEEGIDARVLLVTDDIASAPADERGRRRGIAGDFVVFKLAAAAAEAGADLDGVVEVARRANGATRTLGVAFDGCTMPGADSPLFTVPAGSMSIGLGIHGEPGVRDVPLVPAHELAELFVRQLLAERPAEAGARVAAVLNGLGRTKYEELFAVWRTVARLLREAGCDLVEPEVGELVTSLDMAGCSLTLTWLDDELERLWRAPAEAPAYRKGRPAGGGGPRRQVREPAATHAPERVEATVASRRAAGAVLRGLAAVTAAVAAAEDELGRIDAVAGDGDHGRGMVRGLTAALSAGRAAEGRGAGVADVLGAAGRAWADRAGGTSGVLWGAALESAAGTLRRSDPGDPRSAADAVVAAAAAIRRIGGAEVGDKTLLDSLVPFADALQAGVRDGDPLRDAWGSAVRAARAGADGTAALVPRVGRARPLAERSIGAPDAGAVSTALMVAAALDGVLVVGADGAAPTSSTEQE